jgi:hypothetical protein
MAQQNTESYKQQQNVVTGKNEDVEFNAEMADADDLEAAQRAKQADARQERSRP